MGGSGRSPAGAEGLGLSRRRRPPPRPGRGGGSRLSPLVLGSRVLGPSREVSGELFSAPEVLGATRPSWPEGAGKTSLVPSVRVLV